MLGRLAPEASGFNQRLISVQMVLLEFCRFASGEFPLCLPPPPVPCGKKRKASCPLQRGSRTFPTVPRPVPTPGQFFPVAECILQILAMETKLPIQDFTPNTLSTYQVKTVAKTFFESKVPVQGKPERCAPVGLKTRNWRLGYTRQSVTLL